MTGSCSCLYKSVLSCPGDKLPSHVQVLNEIDLILISHPDPCHLGALPFLVGRRKLQVPVYATAPCHKMGQMFMYDQYLSRQQSSDFSTFTLDDVDAAFRNMRHLKFQQQVKLTGILPALASLQVLQVGQAFESQTCNKSQHTCFQAGFPVLCCSSATYESGLCSGVFKLNAGRHSLSNVS